MKKLKYKSSGIGLLFLSIAPLASAGLLLDPTGGSSVGFPSNSDGDQVRRNLGGTFSLFGSSITSINIATNGFIGTSSVSGRASDRDVETLAAVVGGPVVAALYDDLVFGPGTMVTDQSVANTYYALTYQSIYGFANASAGMTADFQIILFMGDTTLAGFQFQAGDIAISYGRLNNALDGTFSVGVALDQTNWTPFPDTIGGQLSDLGVLPTGAQFLLFRPETQPILPAIRVHLADEAQQTVYQVSVESATPEPDGLSLVGAGLILAGFLKLSKSKKEK
jgi:hypothetical protein